MTARLRPLLVLLTCAGLSGCASTIVKPAAPRQPASEALLVIPGFGYGAKAEKAISSLAPAIAADGLDLYVPAYLSRHGLDRSRANLQRFIREQHLDRYQRVHVFAFIAGGWTFNALEDRQSLRLATVVYDRSPYQERAPRVAAETIPLLAWLRYGSTVGNLAKTPYQPLAASGVKVALMVETRPSGFIRRFSKTARGYGDYRFDCDAFAQPYDDCLYLSMEHGEVYLRFAEVWPELRAFIRTGRFTSDANRVPPSANELERTR